MEPSSKPNPVDHPSRSGLKTITHEKTIKNSSAQTQNFKFGEFELSTNKLLDQTQKSNPSTIKASKVSGANSSPQKASQSVFRQGEPNPTQSVPPAPSAQAGAPPLTAPSASDYQQPGNRSGQQRDQRRVFESKLSNQGTVTNQTGSSKVVADGKTEYFSGTSQHHNLNFLKSKKSGIIHANQIDSQRGDGNLSLHNRIRKDRKRLEELLRVQGQPELTPQNKLSPGNQEMVARVADLFKVLEKCAKKFE